VNGINLQALRALRDCGAVTAKQEDPRFKALVNRGLAISKPFPSHENDPFPRRCFQLTSRGGIVADAILTVGP
jgi:hypothetical protein